MPGSQDENRQALTPRVLALLDEAAGRQLRLRYLNNPDVYAGLCEVERIAMAWRISGGADATGLAISPDPAASLLTTDQVADLVGVTPNAVRQACRTGRLAASKRGDSWFITAAAAAAYLVRLQRRR